MDLGRSGTRFAFGLRASSGLCSDIGQKPRLMSSASDVQQRIDMTKISVLIPAYNCTATLRETVESVLAQTRPADEVLIMDDGSTDETRALAQSYEPQVKVFWQSNGGVAQARNALTARATGELIAFLDSDDLWHPRYLEVQLRGFEKYPQAVAFFAAHQNFIDGERHVWTEDRVLSDPQSELIDPVDFFRRYHAAPGPFYPSYCAVRAKRITLLGDEPFKGRSAEDSYCFSLLSLVGPVVYCSEPLGAYRIRSTSLSADQVRMYGSCVHVFEILEERFRRAAIPELRAEFSKAFAARRRSYAKLLMGAGKKDEARAQLRRAAGNSIHPVSLAKTGGMLGLTYLPRQMQPTWPSTFRDSTPEAPA